MQITGIIESCLYVADLDRTEAFYTGLLGFEKIGRCDGRHVFFRVGGQVLLCFIAAATAVEGAGATHGHGAKTPHGAAGCQHVAFEVPTVEYEAWKVRIEQAGLAILDEVHWKPGVASFYFYDPDGHLLEILQPGLWHG